MNTLLYLYEMMNVKLISQYLYVKPLCCTLETHTVRYVSYISIKLEDKKPPKQWMNEHKWDKTSSALLLAPMTCEAGPLLSWVSKEPTGKHIHWVLGLERVFFYNVCPVITWTHDKSRNCTTAPLLALHFLKKINTKLWDKHTAFRISLNLFFFFFNIFPKEGHLFLFLFIFKWRNVKNLGMQTQMKLQCLFKCQQKCSEFDEIPCGMSLF